MTTAGNVLVLLGTIVTACGLLIIWAQNSDTPQKWRARWRQLTAKAKRWARFGRPGDPQVIVVPSITRAGKVGVPRVSTAADDLARIEHLIDDLASRTATERADDRQHSADLIKQAINEYRAEQRTTTRHQTWIAGIGVALTLAGTALLLLAG